MAKQVNTLSNTSAAAVVTHKPASDTPLVDVATVAAPAVANAFDALNATVSVVAAEKVANLVSARASLEDAKSLYDMGESHRADADKSAGVAALSLYQGRKTGTFSSDEVSEVLRSVFGCKPKADGSDGLTPAGEGEAIRKRIVRAVSVAEAVAGNIPEKGFMAGLPASAIEDMGRILEAVEAGKRPLFTAYDDWQKIKSEHKPDNDPAFDPKKVAALIDKLAGEDAVARIEASPMLFAAYGQLRNMINAIGEEIATRAAIKADNE